MRPSSSVNTVDTVIGVAEAILRIARELRAVAKAGGVKGAQEKISELREAVSQARSAEST